MTIYGPITFQNDSAPAINASALNYIQDGIVSAHVEIASQGVLLDSTIAYASSIAGNIGANATAIAVNAAAIASQGAAISSLATADAALATAFAGQSGAVASSTAALATAGPLLIAYGSQLAEHTTQIEAQASQVGPLATVVAGHTVLIEAQGTQIDVVATTLNALAPQLAVLDSVATTLGQQATQLAGLQELAAGAQYAGRSGRGPVDLWLANTSILLAATSGEPRAMGAAVTPDAEWPVTNFTVHLERNGGSATPLGDFSVGVLDQTGALVAYSTPTQVPSIGTSIAGLSISVPNAVPSVLLDAGSRYYFILATDDADRMVPIGVSPNYAAIPGLVARGLLYGWELPSGLDFSIYSGLPLSIASTIDPTLIGIGAPAVWVS